MKIALTKTARSLKEQLLVAVAIVFFMLLTRGSHFLTNTALPDASIVLFLLGGMTLGNQIKSRLAWFMGFFILGAAIDFGSAAIDPAQGFCLSNGYWGLIPAYALMWLGGMWLTTQKDAFNLAPYAMISLIASFAAFVVSTQTYYLFSGRFPAHGLLESLKHGWVYLPSWMAYASMYFAATWAGVQLVRIIKASTVINAKALHKN